MILLPITAFLSSVALLAVLGFRDKAKYIRERDERLSRMKSGQSGEVSPGAKVSV